MRGITKDFEKTWIVVDCGCRGEKYDLAYGPTSKDNEDIYRGKCPWYELIELKVVSRRMGGQAENTPD